ncbi:GNAT family N-acetyltransferase [Rhizobium tibeticum]|uniref:GNAT family N-acetyltransferase n=1 Tax=Rhizobium tibeticum TaxID=501024 RepID=UPI0027D82145|nr:GNAT family N-acetyltransferase [Rhizobium tibeticum]
MARPRAGTGLSLMDSRPRWPTAGRKLIIIDHTEVPAALRGRKVGERLVRQAVEDARREGITIIPLCPFAKAQIERHAKWKDVLRK